MNYSSLAKERGLILHTSITIGYDVPWPQVHELMLAAAGKTKFVERDPAPFILQKALNDWYVEYELNAYTRDSHRMARIYSDLHAHIQDGFRDTGVEIMSPHYMALRDGNTTTIPGAAG
jgi:small-conductance mechanosensitive channel